MVSAKSSILKLSSIRVDVALVEKAEKSFR